MTFNSYVTMLFATLCLTGCMCAPEKGESVFTSAYFSECWKAAKGKNN